MFKCLYCDAEFHETEQTRHDQRHRVCPYCGNDYLKVQGEGIMKERLVWWIFMTILAALAAIGIISIFLVATGVVKL